MNFKRYLPLTIDLLLNVNERAQQRLSKYAMDPSKGKQMAKRKGHHGKAEDGTMKLILLLMPTDM